MRDQLGGRIAPRDFNGARIAQERGGQLSHLVRKRSGEEQVLALRRQQRKDPANVGDEPHVEHPVGLVEHQDLDLTQIHGLLPRMVEQASGRRNDDVHAATQRIDLRLHANPAEDHRGTQREVLAVGPHILVHLGGKLTGRRDDQGAREFRCGAFSKPLQHGQREPCGLAGAGLCGAEQIAAAQYQRDRLRLNRGGLRVALFGNCAQ